MVKVLFALLFSFGLSLTAFAQTKAVKLPGTVQIDSNTAMKFTEVSLHDWLDLIVNNESDTSLFPAGETLTPLAKVLFDDLKQKKYLYLKIINHNAATAKNIGERSVRTTAAFDKLADADTNYFSLNIPVTGITFEQAQRYCKWKEDVVNRYRDVKVSISLPTVEIYKRVITNIDTLCKDCESYRLNCSTARPKKPGKDKREMSQGRVLENSSSYFPTALGLYNIQGNAAEMTDTYGIAMGGSFRHTARESYNDKMQQYNKAEDWLGFRFIVTVRNWLTFGCLWPYHGYLYCLSSGLN